MKEATWHYARWLEWGVRAGVGVLVLGFLGYLMGFGDFGELLGIAILAGCSLLPLARLAVLYVEQRDWIYAGITGMVALVLVLAALGVAA